MDWVEDDTKELLLVLLGMITSLWIDLKMFSLLKDRSQEREYYPKANLFSHKIWIFFLILSKIWFHKLMPVPHEGG